VSPGSCSGEGSMSAKEAGVRVAAEGKREGATAN